MCSETSNSEPLDDVNTLSVNTIPWSNLYLLYHEKTSEMWTPSNVNTIYGSHLYHIHYEKTSDVWAPPNVDLCSDPKVVISLRFHSILDFNILSIVTFLSYSGELGGRMAWNKALYIRTVPKFNSCSKCMDSPGIIHDSTPDWHPCQLV